VFALILLLSLVSLPVLCAAQEAASEPEAVQENIISTKRPNQHHSRVGIGFKMSTLGAGIEFATRLTSRSNLRTGFNIFDYSRPFDTDGITYKGQLNLRSAQINYDWFPFHGAFHLSPGVLLYNGNRITANLSVPSGRTFNLDHSTVRSDPKDPIRGNASITFNKVAPALLMGWGNLIPRRSRHFSFPFEFGFVYHGQPNLSFDLVGKGCDPKGRGCRRIDVDPKGISSIANERAQINRDISVFRFYPIVSGGFAFNF
jgi:hypothetical protein